MNNAQKRLITKRLKKTMEEIVRLCALIKNPKNLLIMPNFSTSRYKLNLDGTYESAYRLNSGKFGKPKRKIKTGT